MKIIRKNLMNVELEVNVNLSTINCGECGGTYAINERYREQKEEEGGSWTCPYCQCGWGYTGNSKINKLEREIKTLRKQKEWTELDLKNQKNQTRAFKGEATKAKNKLARTKVGVCPCCNRTFKQLAAHMKNKHPAWKPKL